MQQASEGISLSELIDEIDSKLTYGEARKFSDFEAKLLDQIDDSYDAQIESQADADHAKNDANKTKETLEKYKDAIDKYCSKATMYKIFLASGWQFMPEESQQIQENPSDKELILSLQMEDSEQKKQIEKLQTMLQKSLAFAQTVRDSRVGKLFFGKKAKEVLGEIDKDTKQLTEGR